MRKVLRRRRLPPTKECHLFRLVLTTAPNGIPKEQMQSPDSVKRNLAYAATGYWETGW